ncbi:MAG: hypothetical protein AAGB93_15865 [Planctomycetota bacterium]
MRRFLPPFLALAFLAFLVATRGGEEADRVDRVVQVPGSEDAEAPVDLAAVDDGRDVGLDAVEEGGRRAVGSLGPSGEPDLVLEVDRSEVGPHVGALQLYSAFWRGGGEPVAERIEVSGDRLAVHLTERVRSGTWRHGRYELRNAEATATSGAFGLWPETRERPGTREVLGLRLVPVGRVVFTFERDEAGPFAELMHSDAIEWRRTTARSDAQDGRGRTITAVVATFGARDRDRETFSLERCTRDSVDVTFRFPGHERVDVSVDVTPGRRTERTIRLRRPSNVSRFSGRVTTASGAPLDVGGQRGRVRIVDTSDRTQQFNVDLEWEGGVARWESAPMPAGEYRLWLDDCGVVTSVPAEEVVHSPPLSGVDWLLEDAGERRTIAVRVFARESGERLRDGVEVATLWSDTRRQVARLFSPRLRGGVPLGSSVRFVLLAPGREPIELGMGDFGEPGWVLRSGEEWTEGAEPRHDGVRPAFFANVAPRRLGDLGPVERTAAEERLRAVRAR